MNIFKRFVSCILTAAMLISVFPCISYAEGDDEYKIVSNKYMSFTFNSKTGGFSIETAEGNPKKVLDDNIPLLYAEDKERSGGTSFITVRIGDKDYIFGQDYGFFGMASQLGTPVVSEEGRLIEIPWEINGIKVTLKAALGNDDNSDITGNVGLSFNVQNNSGKDENISIRVLLDTALGNRIDAPYFTVDTDQTLIFTETELSGSSMPSQIRGVDSLTEPTRLLYILTKGFMGGSEPDKVILGHWANMANTRYSYTADEYCDFSNYSNTYREPDSAASIYWENKAIPNGGSFTGEMLYGVGNFSRNAEKIGVNIVTGRVELADDGVSYKNDGIIDVIAEIDNTVDDASVLGKVVLNLSFDENQFELLPGSGEKCTEIAELGKEVKTFKYSLRAKVQEELSAGTVYFAVTGVKTLSDGTVSDIETAAQRSIILPGTGKIPEIQFNKINPKIVYTDGQKAVTLSGSMKPLMAILADDAACSLKLRHETSGHEITVKKQNIAFLDESGETLTFTTDETLYVGKYELFFEINDSRLWESLGKRIICSQKLQVSADKKYSIRSYGLIALVRTIDDKNSDVTYDFYKFQNESEFLKFYKGEISANGALDSSHKIKYNFGENKEAIKENEILITVRANIREMEKTENGQTERFWQADYSSGDIIINNMLSYEGDKPLKIYEKNGIFKIEGDGLLKVVNSINVWRSKWSISVNNGAIVTLDEERLKKAMGDTSKTINSLNLSLDGAASMIQAIGGFAIDLKYGVLSSNWYDNSDGMVTYGIGFGGSMSIPIKAKSKKEKDLTADQEDISEELNNLFDESLTADQEDISGDMNSLFDESPKKTSTGDRIKKDTNLSEGQLSAAVNNVLFGENGDVENGAVKVRDTGFIGIDAELSLALPKDVLGSLVANSPGVYASFKINTIDNKYEINAGLNIKIIECEGILAFKQVNVKNKDVIVPDKIEFYIRDGLKIPVAPPVLFIAGLGGGINELADTIGGEFDKLPPITILLFTRLEAIGVLTGDFNAKINLEGMSLTGDMKLKAFEKLMNLNAGINARWIEPWELNLYGSVSIIDGLIKGGITVTIADNYFYGYVFASICIPDSIPFVGGKELAGVEAAVSDQFIGANIKILGIRFGVIYYWGEKVSFGKNIDLSAPPRNGIMSLSAMDDVTGCYGTNIHMLSVMSLSGAAANSGYREATVTVSDAEGHDALLIEIPYIGSGIPEAGQITLINKDGETVITEPDDGAGGGNMLVQSREDGDFIYVTVTDKNKIKNGKWTVRYTTPNIEIETFGMNAVDSISEIESSSIAISKNDADKKTTDVTLGWSIKNSKPGSLGNIDVYLTEDAEILNKIKTSKNTGDALGVNILHKENTAIESGSQTVTLPDSLPSGKYYAVTTLSTAEGISLAISGSAVDFVNANLPSPVAGVKISYGGNNEIFVNVTDSANLDYTHYLAEIVPETGTVLENNIGQFEAGKSFVFGKEAGLEAGKKYKVNIRTLREEYKESGGEYKTHYYYGTDIISSNEFEITEEMQEMPVLKSVKTNFDTSGDEINTNKKDIVIEYTFENDVFVEMKLNGSNVYAFGDDPANERNFFRKDWKFVLDDLDDGDYVVDFTAYTSLKNHIKGSQTGIKDAYLGFTIDSSAPVLSLSQNTARSVDSTADMVFGANTVIANADGSYEFSGMAEKSSVLTADGSADGITRTENGSFKLSGNLNDGELVRTHQLKAVDKAGNISEMMVYVLNNCGFSFKGLELYQDGSKIHPNANGVKEISIKNGQSTKLTANAVLNNNQEFALDNDLIDWSVLYEKNALALNDGNVTALLPKETAVKAKLEVARAETENSVRSKGLTDYVVINILNNSKSDLAEKIEEAKQLLQDTPDASEERKNALQTEIDNAAAVINNPQSADTDYTDSVNALDQAMAAFRRTESRGGGGMGGSSKIYYNITAAETEHGTVKLSHTRAAAGTSVTVTAIADSGYVVSDMLINGVSVGRNDVYTISSIDRDTEVKVIFAEKSDLPFTDVIASDWFYETVKKAYESRLMLGTEETRFEPNANVSRAMFVTVLHRIEGEPEASGHSFGDVADGEYYDKAVAWASKNGIVYGVTETEFAPDADITREQMAAMLFRYAKYKGMDVSVGENTNILSYDDYEMISEYAIAALQWTVGSGILTGKTDVTLNPADKATRAETATVFTRFLNK